MSPLAEVTSLNDAMMIWQASCFDWSPVGATDAYDGVGAELDATLLGTVLSCAAESASEDPPPEHPANSRAVAVTAANEARSMIM